MIYMLWDTVTANLVDCFADEQAALEEVRLSVQEFGREYAASWALAGRDADGRIIAVAEGEGLIDRAFGIVTA